MPKRAGRPTDYNPKMLTDSQKYLSQCEDEEVQVVKQANTEKGYEMYDYKLKVHLPTIEGLASCLGVNRDTLYTWAKAHQEFSDILEELREAQATRLINNGLSGAYNSTITKLMLSKHGYVDKTEHTGEDGGPIEQRIIYLPQRERMATTSRETDGGTADNASAGV